VKWLLPEFIEDILPAEAMRIERLRRRILDLFFRKRYQLVMPPLLEYMDSLLTGTGHDLELRTFKVVDQLSGRMMGLRADITPQVARIDAHLLNRRGVARLCYCGAVLHTRPASPGATREPLQIGAELYGDAGAKADLEILRLLCDALKAAKAKRPRIDIGHVAVFRAIVRDARVRPELEAELFEALPSAYREQLDELPAIVASLEAQAVAARAEMEVLAAMAPSESDAAVLAARRDAAKTHLADSVAALESIRLDLLRLHAGASDLAPLTTLMDDARRIGEDLSRLAEAQREVEDAAGDGARRFAPPS